jgi:hypothetical protein
MDDLTNSFNYFVTSGDYCSHTNLASNIHPRLLDYKKKSKSFFKAFSINSIREFY